MNLILVTLGLVSLALLYFLPSLIAVHRKHNHVARIVILNVIFGWTIFGWFGALVWSLPVRAARITLSLVVSVSVTTFLVFYFFFAKPSEPPVGANLDPSITSNVIRSMAGTWVYERQVIAGVEVPIETFKNATIVISGNSLQRVMYRPDGTRMTPILSDIYVDPTTYPKQMDDDSHIWFYVGRRPGIYKLEGDRLTLCYDNTGNKRPTEFASFTDSSFVLTVLRRQKK